MYTIRQTSWKIETDTRKRIRCCDQDPIHRQGETYFEEKWVRRDIEDEYLQWREIPRGMSVTPTGSRWDCRGWPEWPRLVFGCRSSCFDAIEKDCLEEHGDVLEIHKHIHHHDRYDDDRWSDRYLVRLRIDIQRLLEETSDSWWDLLLLLSSIQVRTIEFLHRRSCSHLHRSHSTGTNVFEHVAVAWWSIRVIGWSYHRYNHWDSVVLDHCTTIGHEHSQRNYSRAIASIADGLKSKKMVSRPSSVCDEQERILLDGSSSSDRDDGWGICSNAERGRRHPIEIEKEQSHWHRRQRWDTEWSLGWWTTSSSRSDDLCEPWPMSSHPDDEDELHEMNTLLWQQSDQAEDRHRDRHPLEDLDLFFLGSKRKRSPVQQSSKRRNDIWIDRTKLLTLIGWMRRIEEKRPARSDVNHFCVLESPNSIPRTIMKKIDTIANSNEQP